MQQLVDRDQQLRLKFCVLRAEAWAHPGRRSNAPRQQPAPVLCDPAPRSIHIPDAHSNHNVKGERLTTASACQADEVKYGEGSYNIIMSTSAVHGVSLYKILAEQYKSVCPLNHRQQDNSP